jgi:hypothetical protein
MCSAPKRDPLKHVTGKIPSGHANNLIETFWQIRPAGRRRKNMPHAVPLGRILGASLLFQTITSTF